MDGPTRRERRTQRGFRFGEMGDFSYDVVKDGVHVHDLDATIRRSPGVDRTRLTDRFQAAITN